MTAQGKGPSILMGTMVMDNLYTALPTLEKVTRCPVSLILTRSYCTGHQGENFILFDTIPD
jgi:hypothetical protein